MIKKYQNSAGVMTRIADALIVGAVWLLAYPIRFNLLKFLPFEGMPELNRYLALLPLVLVLWMAGFQFFGVYRYDRGMRRSIEVYSLLRAHLGTMILFTSLTYFITQYRFSRTVMIIFGLLVFFLCWIFRAISRKVLRELHRKGMFITPLLAVGSGKEFQFLLGQLRRYPELGMHTVGEVPPSAVDMVPRLIQELRPKVVLISLTKDEGKHLPSLIQSLKDETIDIHIIPDYSEYFALGATVESFDGIPLIHLNESPLFGVQALLKRGMDFFLSFLGLLVLSPLLILVSLLVKLTSRGPVLFRQERMGLDGHTFHMLKFRSMKIDAEAKTGAVWAVENDHRRTVLGKVMRSTSIDELPQLWNVMVGDMSLVGPRPERPVFVDKFRNEIPHYMLRHKVKTGITGWAQVNGWRGDTSLEKRIECDIYYIRNWSVWLDLKILLLTVLKGFVNKNAY